MMPSPVRVEIVAKAKGCVLCDLALMMLEEIAEDLDNRFLSWSVVDVGDQDGLKRLAELTVICGRKPPIPSLVINEQIAFEHIPDMEALNLDIRQRLSDDRRR